MYLQKKEYDILILIKFILFIKFYHFHKQSENINKFYNSLYKTVKNKKKTIKIIIMLTSEMIIETNLF